MPDALGALVRSGRLTVDEETASALLYISPATIDRLLAPERARTDLTGRATTKPGTLLKSQIAVRTGVEWNDTRPGSLEIDLVAHCGASAEGEYCNTLDATDIATGWTETRAVRNKAQVHVFAALKDIRAALPFPLLGIDSDTQSECDVASHFRGRGSTVAASPALVLLADFRSERRARLLAC